VLRVAVWSPLPPSPSGIADYVSEQLPHLARSVEVVSVAEDPGEARPDADLDLYHLGNSPAHGYVYRAALSRPGVAVLHDWSLHHLVLAETVERGDVSAYLREMRRAHGETGTFVGRQVARALGGDLLPALFPLNDRVLEASLAVVGLTRYVASRAALRLPGRPVLHLPHHLSLPLDPLPSREQARRALGLPPESLLVTAPGLATASKRIDAAVKAVARLLPAHPSLRLVIAGGVDPRLPLADWARDAGLGAALVVTGRLELADFVRHLVAADVVLALRFPTHGEVSGALVRALGVGRPVLVTGGTPPSEEFPEGIVVPVDPGTHELDELTALVDRLLRDPSLRDAIGRLARDHVRTHHGLGATAGRLSAFLTDVHARKAKLLESLVTRRAPEGSLLSYLLDEVRRAALDLGLSGVPVGFEPLLDDLAPERR
jgi:glycosyltransferase involved in cell wall biosynthesis